MRLCSVWALLVVHASGHEDINDGNTSFPYDIHIKLWYLMYMTSRSKNIIHAEEIKRLLKELLQIGVFIRLYFEGFSEPWMIECYLC